MIAVAVSRTNHCVY
ncbi:hypothetical protein [Nannocystis pusilla]